MKVSSCPYCKTHIHMITLRAERRSSSPVIVACDTDLMRTWTIPGKKGGVQIRLVTASGKLVSGQEVKVSTPNSQAVEGYMPHEDTCRKSAAS